MTDEESVIVQDFADRPLPVDTWSADLTSRSGYAFHVRPVEPSDEAELADFFTNVDRDDGRFRFLSATATIEHDQIFALMTVDHRRTENFVALELVTGRIIAIAMIAADEAVVHAEVAIAIRADFKRGGISWALLDHVAAFARAKGMKTLGSIESRDNYEAIRLERERGWTALPCPGEPTLMILRAALDHAALVTDWPRRPSSIRAVAA